MFCVSVPENIKDGQVIGNLRVRRGESSVPIGQIHFTMEIVCQATTVDTSIVPTGTAHRYRRAFASYASVDRQKVLPRIQMLQASGIECFMDLLDLRAGMHWEQELFRRIDESDVLFLFWSSAASQSDWVNKEWHYALTQKGDCFILPVAIECPIPRPPDELKHIHFDDRILHVTGG